MGSKTSCEAQEIGLHIGEYLAIVDSNATICHGPTVMGIQESGCVGSTAGPSKNRANLSIYWGCNAPRVDATTSVQIRHLSERLLDQTWQVRPKHTENLTIIAI